jgi:hypothetical protein
MNGAAPLTINARLKYLVGAPHWRLIWQSDHRCQIWGVSFDAAFPTTQIVSGHREPQ